MTETLLNRTQSNNQSIIYWKILHAIIICYLDYFVVRVIAFHCTTLFVKVIIEAWSLGCFCNQLSIFELFDL